MDKKIKIQITGIIDENKTVKKMNKQITKLESQIKKMKLSLDSSETTASSNGFNTLNKALKSVNLTSQELKKNFTEHSVELKKLNTELSKNGKTMTTLQSQYLSYANVQKNLGVNLSSGWTKLNSEISSNGTISERWTNNAGKIVSLQGQIIDGQTKWIGKTKEVNQAVETNAKQADKWKYSWSQAFQSFTTYMTVTQFFYTTVHTIKDMIYEVTDLNSALIELNKVTDLTSEGLDNLVKKAYEAAEGLAKTGTEVIEATTEFAKAGYDENTALELGKIALMYTNIADEAVNAGDAANFIIAQLKAFNIEATDAMHVIDAVNEVANKFAVSSADIANNLGSSSAVMANAGNSFEQMIGLLTAGTEITRSATKVSNGLKTITLRLQENLINPWYVQKCA